MREHQAAIIHFSIGLPKSMEYGNDKQLLTGICKESVEEAYLTKDGFRGDGVADLRYHGGPDRAVCIYPNEHYALWDQEFGQPLPAAAFGENMTLSNMLEKDVYIGDIYRFGEAVVQITQGRVPCSTITKRLGKPTLLKRMTETGYTGYLCRVLEEGIVRKDSKIELIQPHPQQISILYCNQLYYQRHNDIEGLRKVLTVSELADEWKLMLNKRLEQALEK
ncbi:MOSC domain-containing protein [Paenibacillus marinisediminis]